MKKTNLKAFTLAEVLITLTIIGAAAAITVPALIQRTNKQEYVSALKKAYSTLAQASQMITAENGSPKCNDGGWACSIDDAYNMYKKYLSNVKECGSEAGCMPQSYTYINGSPVPGWIDAGSAESKKLIAADGSLIWFHKMTASNNIVDCNYSDLGDTDICFFINVDVNGSKKPNKLGRDMFYFAVQKDGRFLPFGCSKSCSSFVQACACQVLREGAMNY